MSVVALVPARQGSKRVPGKNVRRLHDHPLLAYTVAAARASGAVARVVVSTDSPEVAEIARHYGADVPFLRPAELAGDSSPDIDWVEHALAELRAAGEEPEAFALLRPTSPLRPAATIAGAVATLLSDPEADSLRAVSKVREHPGKMWTVDGARMSPLLGTGPGDVPWHSTPYQQLPVVHVQNASLEVAWTATVDRTRSIAGDVVIPWVSQGFDGFDVNDEADWRELEFLVSTGAATLPTVEEPPYPDSSREVTA